MQGTENTETSMNAADIKHLLAEAGAFRSAIAAAGEVDSASVDSYRSWIASGKHGEMAYLEKYDDLRSDPRLLLDGARSVISCAFSYGGSFGSAGSTESTGSAGSADDYCGGLQWAEYALGDDYHDVVRKRLSAVAETIKAETGAECRVCVDTAPLRERYWAVRSGLGFIGLNNQLIIPDGGSRFFLGEILTTLELEPDSPEGPSSCMGCGRCIAACPGKALSIADDGKAELDARKCLSYLTIEYRGELPPDTRLGSHVYGCDECQRVCPHNRQSPRTEIMEFQARREITDLSAERIAEMSQEAFSSTFRRSAIKRTKLAGLQRNALKIIQERASSQSPEDGGREE